MITNLAIDQTPTKQRLRFQRRSEIIPHRCDFREIAAPQGKSGFLVLKQCLSVGATRSDDGHAAWVLARNMADDYTTNAERCAAQEPDSPGRCL